MSKQTKNENRPHKVHRVDEQIKPTTVFTNNDLLPLIFVHLADNPFFLKLVCKQWYQILKTDHTWRSLCNYRWPSLSVLPSSFEFQSPVQLNNPDIIPVTTIIAQVWEIHRKQLLERMSVYPAGLSMPSSSWEELFRKRHQQSLHFSIDLKKAVNRYQITEEEEDVANIGLLYEALKETKGIPGYWDKIKRKNIKLQFIADSAIYGLIRNRVWYGIEDGSDHSQENTSVLIYGSIMTLDGNTVTFYQVLHETYSPGWGDCDSHILSVGRYSINVDYGKENQDDNKKFNEWLKNVRGMLGLNSEKLLEIWRLLKELMFSTPRTNIIELYDKIVSDE